MDPRTASGIGFGSRVEQSRVRWLAIDRCDHFVSFADGADRVPLIVARHLHKNRSTTGRCQLGDCEIASTFSLE